jgi:membrane fusion protein (multidrug efflux system)
VTLSNELEGRIVAIGFEPGARVVNGQMLVRLDSSEERAQLAAAIAEADLARLDLTRAERLIDSGAVTEETRDQARARFDAASAEVARLEAVVAKKNLSAPFDAHTGLHELETGQYLQAGTTITRLTGIDEQVWIDFTLPQQTLPLEPGTEVSLADTVTGRLRAEIIARDTFVSDQSRQMRYRALADNLQARLAPGSLVTVNVPAGTPRSGILVPATAVRRDTFGAHVYVIEPEAEGESARWRAARRSVELGPQQGRNVVVTAGLQQGEMVAADGAFKLRDGALVSARPVGAAAEI